MKVFLFLLIIILFSVEDSSSQIENKGVVIDQKVVEIQSISMYGGKNEDGKDQIKYSCLGATQQFVKLSILDTVNDTAVLFIEMNNFVAKYSWNQLLFQEVKYTAYPESYLMDYRCGYDIPEGHKYHWLNGILDNIILTTPLTE